jgi:Membrane bound hydrogenase subunit mbhL
MDIPVPERADYIRTIIAELERIQSHLLWAGVAAHELGFDSLFHLAWRVREESMDVIELITGNRVNYGIVQVGGVRRDIVEEQFPASSNVSPTTGISPINSSISSCTIARSRCAAAIRAS